MKTNVSNVMNLFLTRGEAGALDDPGISETTLGELGFYVKRRWR